ncbi:chromosome 9 open reading frame 64 L homeolog isoform X2 [Xenopus laevis]|nr:chromosome 9 open reading frame 64 L homeolog isoform X2 [Xenopus laevis]
MPKCIVNGCSHGSRGKTPSPNVVLHVFPGNIDIIKRWLMAIGQNFGDLDTYAQRIIEGKKTDSFRICSCHFTEDSYTFQGRRKALKKSATPTLFLWNGSASNECKAVPAKRPRPNKDDHSESLPAQSRQNSTSNSSSKETSAGQSQTKKKTKKLGYSNDPTRAKQNSCKRNASTQTIIENDTDPSYYCSHCASPLTSKTSVQTSDLLPSEPAPNKTNFVDSDVQSEHQSKPANFQDVKMEVEEPENTLSDDNTDTTSSFSDDSDASSLPSNLSVDYSIFVEHDTEEDDEIAQSIEPFDVLNTAKDPVDDHTFLVFESCLDKLLLSSRCGRDPNCHSPIKKLKKYVFGSFLTVKAVCQSGHNFHLWDSQPRKGSIYYGNLLVSASILLSGSDFAKVYAMNKLLKLKQMSPSAFKRYRSNYLFPVINHHWKIEQEKVIKQIAGKPVFLVEDNHANIPGCFHQYCTYSLIEGASKKIINFRVEQVSSADTEKQCFKKSLDKLLEKEIQVKSIGTNRKSIRKLVQKDYPGIQHHYNVSHISKCLRNKLSAASKRKNCSQISQWITPAVNHLLWASKTCDGSADLLKKKWQSLMNRVATVHKWETAQLFHGCAHENLSVRCKRKWMKCGSTAFNRFRDIVMSARLIRDLNPLSKICHTDELKLYHNNLLQYWPRTLHCVEDMVVRTQLAALDYNYSVHRGKSPENFTHVQDPSGALQPKVRKCVFDAASKAFLLVILKDIVTFAEGEVNIERQTLSDRFSDNPSLEQRPIKDEQW